MNDTKAICRVCDINEAKTADGRCKKCLLAWIRESSPSSGGWMPGQTSQVRERLGRKVVRFDVDERDDI